MDFLQFFLKSHLLFPLLQFRFLQQLEGFELNIKNIKFNASEKKIFIIGAGGVVPSLIFALKRMKDKGWGRIINLTSISVKEPLNYLVLSNTIRAAVVTWGKSLSVDLAPFGITVNSIIT